MRLLGLILALLGVLVSSVAGECQARSAPDEDFSFVNRPLTDEPTNSIFGTGDGCISSTWPLGRPHIQSRPSDQGFSVWSFHVVNPANLNEYVLFRFVMGTPDAYELKEATNGYISLVMDIRFADGLILRHVINSQLGQEGAVDLWTKGWATWTKWGSTGAVFHGSRDGKEMTVEKGWDGGRTTIYGSLVMKFIAPPRFPCTSNISDPATLEIMPGLGQTNQMPDASTSVNLTWTNAAKEVRTLKFDNGIGFHEQLWSNYPLRAVAPVFRRGNARLHVVGDPAANHSVVWWEGTKPDGTRYSTAYASMDGTIVKEGCDVPGKSGGLLAIDSNGNKMTVVIKVAEGMNLRLEIDKTVPLLRNVFGEKHLQYSRSVGDVRATLGKDIKLTGVAWMEEADFVSPPVKRPGLVKGEVAQDNVEVFEGTSDWLPDWMGKHD